MQMQTTSNLQKELLAMSVAAANMNASKDNDMPASKSRKNKTPARSSFSNNKQQPQQYHQLPRSKDTSSYDAGNLITESLLSVL